MSQKNRPLPRHGIKLPSQDRRRRIRNNPRNRMIFSFLVMAIALLYYLYFNRPAARFIPVKNVIYVSESGGQITHDKRKFATVTAAEAFSDVEPGKTLFFFPGRYKGPFRVSALATEKKPISLQGLPGSVFYNDVRPGTDKESCIQVKESRWVFIESLEFEECWERAIFLKNSQNIYLSDLKFTGSRFAILIKGNISENILIEKSDWTQDPTGKMWTEWDWAETHHGTLRHYNGAFVAGKDARNIVIRKNKIRNAFNGIRMFGDRNNIRNTNANIQIYENLFERIRDNPIEPEGSAFNWWIHHNKIHNAHAWFSLTELAGGFIYIFSNVGWNDEQHGRPGDHDGGTVLKFEKVGPYPDMPIYIFHNTWYFQKDFMRKDSPSRWIRHFNNLLVAQNPSANLLDETNWHESYKFDNDLLNLPIPEFALSKSLWKSAVSFTDIIDFFENPSAGNFRLKKGSPAIDAGINLKIGNWTGEFYGTAPDIGAFEGTFSIKGPQFKAR